MFVFGSEMRHGFLALVGPGVAADHHGVAFRRVQAVRQLQEVQREVVVGGGISDERDAVVNLLAGGEVVERAIVRRALGHAQLRHQSLYLRAESVWQLR